MITYNRILLKMRNVSDKYCRENQNTLLYSIIISQKSCFLRDNVEKYGSAGQPQITIQYDTCTLHTGYVGLQTHT